MILEIFYKISFFLDLFEAEAPVERLSLEHSVSEIIVERLKQFVQHLKFINLTHYY